MKTGCRGKEPTFVIDLFVDGVAAFNNSKYPSTVPIMGKLINCLLPVKI